MGHQSSECPENKGTSSRNLVVTLTVVEEAKEQEVENLPKTSESLLLNKLLLKS